MKWSEVFASFRPITTKHGKLTALSSTDSLTGPYNNFKKWKRLENGLFENNNNYLINFVLLTKNFRKIPACHYQ